MNESIETFLSFFLLFVTQNSNDTGLLIHINSLCDWFEWHLFNITLASGKIRLYLAHTTLDLLLKKTPLGWRQSDTFLRGIVAAFPKRTWTENANALFDLFVRDTSREKEVSLKLSCINASSLMRCLRRRTSTLNVAYFRQSWNIPCLQR